MTIRTLIGSLAALAVMFAATPVAAEAIRIGGTGMALAAMRDLSAAYAARQPAFRANVLPSLGSNGGLRAVAEGAIDIALTARPLETTEAAAGLRIAACARTPSVLVTSLAKPQGIARGELAAMFGNAAKTWTDGTPVRIVLRTRDDSDNAFLADSFPGMAAALESARRRPDVPVAATDQENAELSERIVGSLAAMTLMQVTSERLNVRVLPIDGVLPDLAALESDTYGLARTFCLVLPQQENPVAEAFIVFIRSSDGRRLLREAGAVLNEGKTF